LAQERVVGKFAVLGLAPGAAVPVRDGAEIADRPDIVGYRSPDALMTVVEVVVVGRDRVRPLRPVPVREVGEVADRPDVVGACAPDPGRLAGDAAVADVRPGGAAPARDAEHPARVDRPASDAPEI